MEQFSYKNNRFYVAVTIEEANEEEERYINTASIYINFFGYDTEKNRIVSNIITSDSSAFLRSIASAYSYYFLTGEDILKVATLYADDYNEVEASVYYDGEKCEYTPSKNYGICIVLKLSCGDIFVMEREGWTE